MRHGIKKFTFKKGQDHDQALMRKLSVNFIKHGKIETTLKRAKALKSHMDRLVYKAQKGTQADKNVLMSKLADKKVVDVMLNQIAPSLKDRTTGFTRMYKLGVRQGDSAEVARLEWVSEIKEQGSKLVSKQDSKVAKKQVGKVAQKKTAKASPKKASSTKKASKKTSK